MSSNPVFQLRARAHAAGASGFDAYGAEEQDLPCGDAQADLPALPRAEMPEACARLDESFWQLYYQIEALRTGGAHYVLQVVAACPGSGSTTVAQGFALAAAAESSAPVLLLSSGDAHPRRHDAADDGPGVEPVPGIPHLHVGPLGPRQPGKGSAAATWSFVQQCKERFPIVVLDCLPFDASPLALGLCKHCDGTLLVVQAERDPRRAARDALAAIERFGGIAVGLVLNKPRPHLPAWLDRVLG